MTARGVHIGGLPLSYVVVIRDWSPISLTIVSNSVLSSVITCNIPIEYSHAPPSSFEELSEGALRRSASLYRGLRCQTNFNFYTRMYSLVFVWIAINHRYRSTGTQPSPRNCLFAWTMAGEQASHVSRCCRGDRVQLQLPRCGAGVVGPVSVRGCKDVRRERGRTWS